MTTAASPTARAPPMNRLNTSIRKPSSAYNWTTCPPWVWLGVCASEGISSTLGPDTAVRIGFRGTSERRVIITLGGGKAEYTEHCSRPLQQGRAYSFGTVRPAFTAFTALADR